MEKIKLISLNGLQTFLSRIQEWVTSKLEVLDRKIDKKVWTGTQAELEAAIEQGLVDEHTLIVITDDDQEETVIKFCEMQDIYNLFGLVYEG